MSLPCRDVRHLANPALERGRRNPACARQGVERTGRNEPAFQQVVAGHQREREADTGWNTAAGAVNALSVMTVLRATAAMAAAFPRRWVA